MRCQGLETIRLRFGLRTVGRFDTSIILQYVNKEYAKYTP
jgi:hypothetical protein